MATTKYKIDTKTARLKLPARNEPYWISLAPRRALGYRKTTTGGSWQGKFTNGQGKRFKQALGDDRELDYEAALKCCQAWFKEMDNSPTGHKPDTFYVKDAVTKYLEYMQRKTGGTTSAAYRSSRSCFDKHIMPVLGDIQFKHLTTEILEDWLNSLVVMDHGPEQMRRSKDSANRVLTNLKACFNRFKKAKKASLNIDPAVWGDVGPFKLVAENRKVFLDKQQLNDLINASTGAFKLLVMLGIYTGARLGELTNAKVSDFHGHYLTVDGKTGERNVYLSEDATDFLKTLTSNRDPSNWLLTVNGKQWVKNQHIAHMKAAVKAAGLPAGTVYYTLRHSFISQSLQAGMNIHLLAKNCGNSAKIIESNYAHFMPSDIQDAIQSYAPF